MARERSTGYTVGFAAAVCIVCSILVSSSAVVLRERQEINRKLDVQRNVLDVSGLSDPSEKLTSADIEQRFAAVRPRIIDAATGAPIEGADPQARLGPDQRLVYEVLQGEQIALFVLPVEGKGLWSTLYGFVALAPDLNTIEGITFYEHGETPGLGGEVDNPRWKDGWKGRKAFDAAGQPTIRVIKGKAGDAASDPHRVDGLSGATLTCNGVTHLVQFWLGDEGYGPYLDRQREGGR